MSLLALADVKPHLKIDSNTDDTVLQAKLDAAEAFVSNQTNGAGSLSVTSVTETVYGLREIALTKTPVVSVTSATGEFAGAISLADVSIDLRAGVIRSKANGWVIFSDYYEVVYTTGYATAADLPNDLVEAVRLMTQHFYTPERGPKTRRDDGPDPYVRAMQILNAITAGSFA